MRKLQPVLLFILLILAGCRTGGSSKSKEIIVFHAGSLSVPFKKLAGEYEKRHPGTDILLEPAGSLVCARKVTELKKPCDIVASADYFVISKLLIPDYARWTIRFATNEMVIAYNDKSHYAGEINSENWIDILSRKDVIYSRADPDSDPGGYRSVFVLKLAEKYYKNDGLTERFMAKDVNFIRPKEVDLIALLEAHVVDYVFIYKSVALQHELNYITLPVNINLSSPAFNDLYKTVSLDVKGSSAGSTLNVTGEYINYSLTILDNAPDKDSAVDFVEFLLSPAGMEIFRNCGQDPIIPFSTEQPELIPAKLAKYLTAPKV